MPVDGTWINELGSSMTLVVSDGTSITGTYITPVGAASGTYHLVGYVNSDSDPALGWVVLWSNAAGGDSNSVTVWTGQYFAGPPEVIMSMWLLRSEQPGEGQNWKATQVGEDVFFRQIPQASTARPDVSQLRAPSHPV